MVRNAAGVPTERFPLGDGRKDGLSPFPNALRTGDNGGYQGLGLAIAAGAKRIVLLGYDLSFRRTPQGTKSHWHDGHREKQFDDVNYRASFAGFFAKLAPVLPAGVEVLNASPTSILTCFPKVDVEQFFQ